MKRIRKIAVFCLFLAGEVQAAPLYTVTNLGTLGGIDSIAYGLNDLGQVVGSSTIANGESRAFVYSAGAMTNLGVIGAYASGAPAYSVARSINNAGTIVGTSSSASGDQSFVYRNGQISNLGNLNYGRSSAQDINESGQAVGSALYFPPQNPFLSPHPRAVVYEKGSTLNLGTYTYSQSDASSNAYGINDLGHVVGDVSNGNDTTSFLYKDGVMTDLRPVLGFTNQNANRATDINNVGDIIGTYYEVYSSMPQAYMISDGSPIFLGTLGGSYSVAAGLNETGQVVGFSRDASGDDHAFTYIDGLMQDLNELIDPGLGWALTGAMDVNNVGQIVGWGMFEGRQQAFLLTPISAVPIPPTFILMLTGLGLLGVVRRSQGV